MEAQAADSLKNGILLRRLRTRSRHSQQSKMLLPFGTGNPRLRRLSAEAASILIIVLPRVPPV